MGTSLLGKILSFFHIAVPQRPWTVINAALARLSSAHAATTSFLFQADWPAGNTSGSGYYFHQLEPGQKIHMQFWVADVPGGNPSAKTATVRMWLMSQQSSGATTNKQLMGRYVGELALTGGSTAISTDCTGITRNAGEPVNWVSTIVKTTDKTSAPGMEVYADASNCSAIVAFASEQAAVLVVDMRVGTASGVGGHFACV